MNLNKQQFSIVLIRGVRVLALFMVSLLLLLYFHHRAVAPELRYTIVAEGNICGVVHSIWDRGLESYALTVRNDAVTAGRIRPLHWIHHSIPFILTSLRNGDFLAHDPEVVRPHRINGDLQTHTAFQLLCVAVYLTALGGLICCLTEIRWSGFAFVALVSAGDVVLRENLLLNHCDSGEIGQLLYIALYLATLGPFLKGGVPGRKLEIAGTVFLLLAYCMKETTVVISPVVVTVLLLRLLPRLGSNDCLKKYIYRQVVMHVLLCVCLLVLVWLFRSGDYVSRNYQMAGRGGYWADSLLRSWTKMSLSAEVFRMAILSGISLLYFGWRIVRGKNPVGSRTVACCLLGLLFAGLSVGFFAINVPWEAAMSKYYLPSYTFAFATATVGVLLLYDSLSTAGLRLAALMWGIGSVVYMLKDLPEQGAGIESYYIKNYDYRKAVPSVTRDIIDHCTVTPGNGRVLVVSRKYFPEGGLSFWRTLNRIHHVNIASEGVIVSSLSAEERNYFRRYNNDRIVDLMFRHGINADDDCDLVYFIGNPDAEDVKAMEQAGLSLLREWSAGRAHVPVQSYVRRGTM